MAKIRDDLQGSVHVTDELGRRVVLVAGDAVPDGYTVGKHLLAGGKGSGGDGPDLSGSIDTVLDRVGGDADAAADYLQAEQAAEKPRKGLVEGLQKVIDGS